MIIIIYLFCIIPVWIIKLFLLHLINRFYYQVVSGINTSKECCQVDRKSIDNDLMLTMQCIREDFRRLEKHLSDRLTDLECQLAALVTRISTDKPD